MTDGKTGGNEMPSIPKIDKIIHEPSRLVIVAHLYVVESADFLFLKRQTGMTWGNLSSHISKLEDAGFVEVEKGFVGKKPNSSVRLTDKGRVTFEEYRRNMTQVFDEGSSKYNTKGGKTESTEALYPEDFEGEGSWGRMSGAVTKNLSTFRNNITVNNIGPLVSELQARQLPLMWLVGIAFISLGMRNQRKQEWMVS
jgi:DNA-binding MarR family transcriptional regulator